MPGEIDYPALLARMGSERFAELRPAQQEVLNRYAAEHSAALDLAIQLPTGAGKSLIALLIGEAWRSEGNSVGILSANKTLARQMESEAAELGLEVTVLEGSTPEPREVRAVQRNQRLGIMNYWFYFNQGPSIDPLDLLIMDDAHLAEQALHSLYSLEINRFDDPTVFERLAKELALRLPDYPALAAASGEIEPSRFVGADLLAFHDHADVCELISSVLDGSPLSQDVSYRWNRMRAHLLEANLYIDRHSLWLRPWVYPLATNTHYRASTQRIYMSATIGDPADLRRRLGTHAITRMEISAEHEDSTLGRRLIVLDRSEEQLGSEAALRAALATQPKSVWMCPSRASADRAKNDLAAFLAAEGHTPAPTWQLTSQGNELEHFRRAPAGQLFTAGRFDGMDFQGSECRVFCLPNLPRATNPQEQFVSSNLADAAFLIERLNARIVQALGRGNRAPDDFALYILGDDRFLNHFGRESFRRSIPASINLEIDVAQDHVAEEAAAVAARVSEFLQGHFEAHDQELAAAETGAMEPPGPAPEWSATLAEFEVDGWREMWLGDYAAAERAFERWADSCSEHGLNELGGFARWCQAKAAFLSGRQGDGPAEQRSIALLDAAIGQGGRMTVWFNRLRASLNAVREAVGEQVPPPNEREGILAAWDHHFSDRTTSARRWEKLRQRVSDGLASGSHAQYQEAMEQIGELLGYRAVRPPGQGATDVRWQAMSGGVREMFVLECKIEHEPANELTIGNVDQALGQLSAATTEWGPRGYVPRGAIVTRLDAIDSAAAQRLGPLAVIPSASIEVLWGRLAALLGLFREQWSPEDAEARARAVDYARRHLPPAGWLGRALDSGTPRVDPQALLAEWPAP